MTHSLGCRRPRPVEPSQKTFQWKIIWNRPIWWLQTQCRESRTLAVNLVLGFTASNSPNAGKHRLDQNSRKLGEGGRWGKGTTLALIFDLDTYMRQDLGAWYLPPPSHPPPPLVCVNFWFCLFLQCLVKPSLREFVRLRESSTGNLAFPAPLPVEPCEKA